ncbi:MAG: LuxR family transcriptional regulator, maltose regulon positive regulatory protein [Solirubrobacteraceae bacterium]
MAVCLAPPTSPLGIVRRERLHSALDAAIDRPLTVVAAPAGWGKTVLLSEWSADRGAGWVSVGPEHADASRLVRDVDAALHSELGRRPPAVVLDDVHLLGAPGIAAIRALVRDSRAPIVVASRSDPDLGLPRLRLEGRLGELRGADLAFSADELGALLDELGLELGADRRRQLLERTDGWAAGIRLVAVALLASSEPERLLDEFTGDDRVVADYLTDEVLASQPRGIRDFLLRTCIVDQLDVDLAAGLTERDDAAAILDRLEREGLFIVALDGRRRRYRYHALFAELLRARLRAEQRSIVADLHARAADWFAAEGTPALAVQHALAAGTQANARDLLAEHWLDLIACGHAPPTGHEDDPRLAVAGAHERLEAGDRSAALERLAAVHGATGLAGELAALLRAHATSDVTGARRAAAAVARRRDPDASDEVGRAVALQLLGATEFAAGDVEVAADRLEEAAALAARPGRERLRLDCLAPVAIVEILRGRLSRAQSHAHAALELANEHGWEHALAAGWAHAALAAFGWLRGDLAAAERRADEATAAAYADGDPVLGDAVRALRAHLHAARGDEETARTLMRIVRDATPGVDGVLPRWLDALGPAPWAPSSGQRPAEVVARAVGRLDSSDAGGALRLVMPIAGTGRHHPTVRMSGLLVEAVARDALHEPGAAAALERALALAEAEGLRRPFLNGGVALRRVLARHACRRNCAAPLLSGILDALPAAADDGNGRDPAEPLSERERAVLRLMPTILANTEIASELFVSVNTVKTHLRSIYRKLEVGSRREAVAKARELELL